MADANTPATGSADPADRLAVPPERLTLAKQHAALLGRTAAKVALTLPLTADADDFRRVLAQEARP